MKRRNILWLMTDQHHAACIGEFGHREVATPNIDRLIRQGINYSRAYCNNPICGPSRCCFLTGQYTTTHGVTGNNIHHAEVGEAPNIGKAFRDAGYQTALIGKAHLPKAWIDSGFEYTRFCDLTDSDRNDPRTCHYFNSLVDAGVADEFDTASLHPGHPGYGNQPFVSSLPYEHSPEKWTGDETLAFLENRDSDRPFFAQISFLRPHPPLSPAPEQAELYDPSGLRLPENAIDYFERKLAGKPAFMRRYIAEHVGKGDPYVPENKEKLRLNLAYYYALITMIDGEIGRILKALEDSGELENTIVCYNADHGDFAGEHGFSGKNMGIPECVHRIPFVINYPGGPKGENVDAIVESIDLFPTLCELADVPVPAAVDGQSVLSSQGNGKGKVAAFAHWDCPLPDQSSVVAVRDRTHRLVFYADHPADGELYDMETDPGEQTNLYSDPAFESTRLRLTQFALERLIRFRRVHGLAEDRIANGRERKTAARLIHKHGKRWSEVRALVAADNTNEQE